MAKVQSFDGLINSIQDAFLSVNRMAEQQHLESLRDYFSDDGSPKTLAVKYPHFTDDGSVEYKDVEIPQICLVPVSSLKLEEISVDFKVKLSAEVLLNDADSSRNGDLMMAADAPKKKSLGFIPEYKQKSDDGYANITLKFVSEEAPEGFLRIRDEMIKILP